MSAPKKGVVIGSSGTMKPVDKRGDAELRKKAERLRDLMQGHVGKRVLLMPDHACARQEGVTHRVEWFDVETRMGGVSALQSLPGVVVKLDSGEECVVFEPRHLLFDPAPGWPARNLWSPVLSVRHSELQRVGDSQRSSQCPACAEGVLAMRRDPETHVLLGDDACLFCGQRVEYLDIEDIRKHG